MLCPKCGASLSETAGICYSCGERQPENENRQKQNNTENQQKQYQQTNQQYNYQQNQYQQNQQNQQQYEQGYGFSPLDNQWVLFAFRQQVNSVFIYSLISALSLIVTPVLLGIICGVIALARIPKITVPQFIGSDFEMNELERLQKRLKLSKTLAIIGTVVSVLLFIAIICFYPQIMEFYETYGV